MGTKGWVEMKKTKSIARKLSILIIGLFLLLFAVYAAVTNVMLYNKSIDDAESYAIKNTQLSAAKIGDHFEETAEMLRTTKMMMESMQADGKLTAQLHSIRYRRTLREMSIYLVLESCLNAEQCRLSQIWIKRLLTQKSGFFLMYIKGKVALRLKG